MIDVARTSGRRVNWESFIDGRFDLGGVRDVDGEMLYI